MIDRIEWRNERTPVSKRFDDIYFAVEDGLSESQYVFLSQNDLPARFSSSPQHHIFELGFGTGLNFLLSWQAFKKQASNDSRLIYFSCERFPLDPVDLTKALEAWPSLAAESHELLSQYNMKKPGFLNLLFEHSAIELNLFLGDVQDFLNELSMRNLKADTWFFDGFAPKKNPEMWSASVFQKAASLSNHQARFATFASAGFVRRGLLAAGFQVEKARGFGRKREMLKGIFP